MHFTIIALASLAIQTNALNVLLTNDDGWAVAHVRAQKDALGAAGFNTILSAPAENESGTGSSDAPPKTLSQPCEFNTCPTGSPPTGHNASDTTLNYVNSFPVTSVKFGIQTLAPQFFGGAPDIIVSGPNVGSNLGNTVQISGTVGAATEAAREGIPALAFSAVSGSQSSYTTLRPGDASHLYAAASVTVVQTLIAGGKPFLPPNVALNINYPSSSQCGSGFKFVLTRILSGGTDVQTCGTNHLPTESSVISGTSTCQSSISVFNATNKADVSAATQAIVLQKLQPILSCF